MLIVGGAAALTAISVYIAWLLIQNLRIRWRRRKAQKRHAHGGKPGAPAKH